MTSVGVSETRTPVRCITLELLDFRKCWWMGAWTNNLKNTFLEYNLTLSFGCKWSESYKIEFGRVANVVGVLILDQWRTNIKKKCMIILNIYFFIINMYITLFFHNKTWNFPPLKTIPESYFSYPPPLPIQPIHTRVMGTILTRQHRESWARKSCFHATEISNWQRHRWHRQWRDEAGRRCG